LLSPNDQNLLDHLHKARIRHAPLEELFNFYERLFQAQFDFKARLRGKKASADLGQKEISLTALAEGTPQIAFDDLPIDQAPFVDLYQDIVDLFIRYADYPSPTKKIPQPDTIIRYAREIFDSRSPLVSSRRPAEWVRTASGFVLAAYLQTACEFIMPRIPQEAWHRGYCPVCGGAPSFAAFTTEGGFRTLLCSRCNGEWSFRRFGCPFCLERDQQTYYPGEEERYRLYVCGVCKRYLKTLDGRESASDLCLPVEVLATVSMDIAAQEKGYRSY